MKTAEFITDFVLVFIITFIVCSIVTFLYSLIVHSEGIFDWGLSSLVLKILTQFESSCIKS